jgi:hypothetical protein
LDEFDGLLEIPHPSADQETSDLELARLAPKLVPSPDFSDNWDSLKVESGP